ncbi:MAG: ATP-dependent RecD-like DNA helicase [Dichotomicrobium sp.]
MKQDEALDILKTGVSVFLTGEPGSGKTHTVNTYVDYLRRSGLEPAITASTGIAATHIHGRTIHSWSGIGVRLPLARGAVERIAENRYTARRIRAAAVLIIDEISMLGPEVLDAVDMVCRHVRGSPAPFGGLQVVLVGDFFQIPPVTRKDEVAPGGLGLDAPEDGPLFAHGSQAWRELDPTVCYLHEQYRQSDGGFLELLSAIRADAVGSAERKALAERRTDPDDLPRDLTRLYTHNRDVDRINLARLADVPGEGRRFDMTSRGPDPLVSALKRGCLTGEELELKEGAAVMFVKNDPGGRYVNGTLGVVTGFDDDKGYPLVRTREGRKVAAEPVEWQMEEDGKSAAKIAQVPLRLAWAITVHKSQGMSLDAAAVDLSHAFDYGQGYVALSRVRALDGLHLVGWNERALRVHPQALEKDEEFRHASDAALRTHERMERAEIGRLQDEFVREAGGRTPAPAAPRFGNTRGARSKAYQPWSRDEEDRLRAAFEKGAPIGQIADTLGRKPGAIRSRMRKLGLI